MPRFDIRLVYSDVGGKRFSRTEVPYVLAPGALERPATILPLQPTFTARVNALREVKALGSSPIQP